MCWQRPCTTMWQSLQMSYPFARATSWPSWSGTPRGWKAGGSARYMAVKASFLATGWRSSWACMIDSSSYCSQRANQAQPRAISTCLRVPTASFPLRPSIQPCTLPSPPAPPTQPTQTASTCSPLAMACLLPPASTRCPPAPNIHCPNPNLPLWHKSKARHSTLPPHRMSTRCPPPLMYQTRTSTRCHPVQEGCAQGRMCTRCHPLWTRHKTFTKFPHQWRGAGNLPNPWGR